MADINGIRTDEAIADVLKRLKHANKQKDSIANKNTDINNATAKLDNSYASLVTNNININTTTSINDSAKEDKYLLPWMHNAEKDNKIHYISFNDMNNIVYNVSNASTPKDIAALKSNSNYICDIDYYKSKHFVLCVKQLASNYVSSRTFNPVTESAIKNIIVEDTKILSDDYTEEIPEFTKVASDNIEDKVFNNEQYTHYIVFTDLGVADFITRLDDVVYPYSEPNLSKWFEETSNYVNLINPKYTSNNIDELSNVSNIKDFKYDIITMHRPGIITLDSSDNNDLNYKVNIKLKDEYSFIPMNRILGCLKYYASHNNKSINDLRCMIDKYFILED